MSSNEKVILVVGSLGLDRLLSVNIFPNPDAKVRTTGYHEVGGGNAANTACAMALLKDARIFSACNLRIKLLTKLGDDHVGRQLVQELAKSGVDLSSPLFLSAGPGTTTSFTTIVVSDTEHTRTCLHTQGTCGELTLEDVQHADLDVVFKNVVHLHSDCRHTDASLALAREARRRGIAVSVDAEKDRHIPSQHGLLELATTVFTNANQLQDYLSTRTIVLEHESNRPSMKDPHLLCDSTIVAKTLANSIHPSCFFLRWFGTSQIGKDVVIMKGSMGAIRVKPMTHERQAQQRAENTISLQASEIMQLATENDSGTKTLYSLHTCGVLHNVNIVDTTGAGDAFIGGYLMALMLENSVQWALLLGSWVAGKKLEGPGARIALPRGSHIDDQLGTSSAQVAGSLQHLVGTFGSNQLA